MGVGLNWGSDGPEGPGSIGDPAPCVLCKVPTILRSPKGKPCHKVCAERWLDRQVEAKQRRDQTQVLQQDLAEQAEAKQLRQQARTDTEQREQLLDLDRQARDRRDDTDTDNILVLTLE